MSESSRANALSMPDGEGALGVDPLNDNPAERLHLVEAMRMAEAIVFASAEPVSEKALAMRMPEGVDIPAIMLSLQEFYEKRGVNLVKIEDAWAFRTAGDLSFLMSRDAVQQKKLSRAVETSKGTLDTLMETGWVKMRGRRRTPGRPVTYGTTLTFLDHFGLGELRDLPGMDELKGAGLLSARMPANFSVPLPPSDPDELTEDEEPLTDIDLEELGLLTPRGGDD
jgi:segregation and condensation protein B